MALLVTSLMGCTSATVKSRNEVWLIDSEEVVLFRRISDTKEQAIPIKGNKDMKKFMCISNAEFDDLVRELIDR